MTIPFGMSVCVKRAWDQSPCGMIFVHSPVGCRSCGLVWAGVGLVCLDCCRCIRTLLFFICVSLTLFWIVLDIFHSSPFLCGRYPNVWLHDY